jgi:hypothetical protein
MHRILSTAALLGLLASPAFAQECEFVTTIPDPPIPDLSREVVVEQQGYSGKPVRSPNGKGTSVYSQRTEVYPLTNFYSNCPPEQGVGTISTTTDADGPGNSPAERKLDITTCETTLEENDFCPQ